MGVIDDDQVRNAAVKARQASSDAIAEAIIRELLPNREPIRLQDLQRLSVHYDRKALTNIVDLGERMRKAQREFFKWKTETDLRKARDLERRFDSALRNYRQPAFGLERS